MKKSFVLTDSVVTFVLQDDIKEWLNIQSSDPMSLKFLQFTEIIVSANTAVNNIYPVYRRT